MTSKNLMCLKDMFGDTDNLLEVEIEKLDAFSNHPFRMYEGERLQDMVQSIRELGIITPVIVRRKGERFEILSGHNRTNAACLAGLNKVPVVVKENVTDEEAMLIVTETNLVQRSFADMSHSERALVLYQHHAALKSQGKRTDLLKEVERTDRDITSCQNGEKWDSTKFVAEGYNLSARSISRYLRLYRLINQLKKRVDEGSLPLTVAVELSYLSIEQQHLIENVLEIKGISISIKQAQQIRNFSKQNVLNKEYIYQVLNERISSSNQDRRTKIKLDRKDIEDFFDDSISVSEIKIIIRDALKKYFE